MLAKRISTLSLSILTRSYAILVITKVAVLILKHTLRFRSLIQQQFWLAFLSRFAKRILEGKPEIFGLSQHGESDQLDT